MFTISKPRRLQLFPAVLLLAAVIANAERPQDTNTEVSPARTARLFGEKQNVQGISNFGEVTPTLLRGAQPTQQGLEALAKMGVDIVVDARGDRTKSEGKEVSRLGMEYVAIPWRCPSPQDHVFARFLKLLQQNPGKKVFVHCRQGADRTGMMIASYRMAVEGWSADEAMLEMRHFGFTFPHHFMCPSLARYEHGFPSRLQRNPAFQDLQFPQSSPANSPK